MKKDIRALLEKWRTEYIDVKEQLIVKGDKSNTLEYNLLASEALRLSECILDLTELLFIDEKEKR